MAYDSHAVSRWIRRGLLKAQLSGPGAWGTAKRWHLSHAWERRTPLHPRTPFRNWSTQG